MRRKVFEVVSLVSNKEVRLEAMFTQYANAESFAKLHVESYYPTMVRKIFLTKKSPNYRGQLHTIAVSRIKLFKNK